MKLLAFFIMQLETSMFLSFNDIFNRITPENVTFLNEKNQHVNQGYLGTSDNIVNEMWKYFRKNRQFSETIINIRKLKPEASFIWQRSYWKKSIEDLIRRRVHISQISPIFLDLCDSTWEIVEFILCTVDLRNCKIKVVFNCFLEELPTSFERVKCKFVFPGITKKNKIMFLKKWHDYVYFEKIILIQKKKMFKNAKIKPSKDEKKNNLLYNLYILGIYHRFSMLFAVMAHIDKYFNYIPINKTFQFFAKVKHKIKKLFNTSTKEENLEQEKDELETPVEVLDAFSDFMNSIRLLSTQESCGKVEKIQKRRKSTARDNNS